MRYFISYGRGTLLVLIEKYSEKKIIDEPWKNFPVGTDIKEVRKWFKERFDLQTEDLMYF